jgi:hypothetical protein
MKPPTKRAAPLSDADRLARRRASKIKYYLANLDACRARSKAWAEANPERHKEQMRRGKKKNYALYPEKSRASTLAWLKKNPQKIQEYNVVHKPKSRARGHAAWDPELDRLVMVEAADLRRLRTEATGTKWVIDHIVPLKGRDASGLHNAYNIQVVPRGYNQHKTNKLLDAPPGFVTTLTP